MPLTVSRLPALLTLPLIANRPVELLVQLCGRSNATGALIVAGALAEMPLPPIWML